MLKNYFKTSLKYFLNNKSFATINIIGLSTGICVCFFALLYVQFELSPRDLSMVDLAGTRWDAAGQYTVTVGGGQPGTSAPMADAQFWISGSHKLPE